MMVCALTLSACGGSDAEETGVVRTANQICPMTMTEASPDMQPDMQPARGMNVSPEALFADDIQDPMARIKRAEAAIVDLHRDMNALHPSTTVAAATNLTPQDQVPPPAPIMAAGTAAPQSLSPIVNEPTPVPTATATPVVSKPSPVMDEPAVKTTAPVQSKIAAPSGPVISALRIGEHTGKTRLVLDAGSSVKFTTDLDNSEDLLLVELPGMKWTAAKSGTSSSPAIKSWSTQAMDNGTDGTRLVLVLRQDVAITDKSMIAPDANAAHYRAVIDLKHQGTIRKAAPKVAPQETPEPVKAAEPKAEPAAAPIATTPTPATAEPVKTETAAPQAAATAPAAGTAPATTTATATATATAPAAVTTPEPTATTPAAHVPPPSTLSAPAPSTTTGTTAGTTTATPKTNVTTPIEHGHDTVQDGELLSGGQ
ncbi:hypothetical protein [Micavibrio aeruginosavorus]|uniref:hypothetical protein n=1 Tax=Micavibrio aeruginosavorus TaxID=349221 RepID=UPI003F4A8F3E